MPYTVKKTNGSVLLTLNDFTTDTTSTSLILAGRGVPNYGAAYIDNFVGLCENFSYSSPPISPLQGQLWFNSRDNVLSVQYTGPTNDDLVPADMINLTNWHPIATRDWTFSLVTSTVNNKVITLKGDVNGSGNTTITTSLSNSGVIAGIYNNIGVNAKGIATYGASINYALESEIVSLTAVIASLSNGITPVGGIIIWSGALNAIPTHWQLCDGTNGTYDIRDRFIVGAGGTYAVGSVGGVQNQSTTTANGGDHNHNGSTGAHVLTIDEIPSHNHSAATAVGDPGHKHGILESNNITTGTNPTQPVSATNSGPSINNNNIQLAATNISVGVSIGYTGSGWGHSHTIDSSGPHNHAVAAWDNRPPYLALAYIQRIS